MNYTEALAYLDGYVNFERTAPDGPRAMFGLARLRELAARLGDPQEEFPALHVAGTKGKGSVCAFAAAMLQAAGLRVGLYTSPHLVHVRERIRVDGAPIAEERFAQLLTRCRPVLEKMRVRPAAERRLTYFEVLTHLAFLHFAETPVDVAVVEVGMGGRLDATNIVEPVACGIASLGLEHTRILGSTLPQIAREKAGIFKPGARGVSAPQPQDAAEVLVEMAGKVGLPLEFLGRELQLVTRPAPADHARPALLPRLEAEVRSTAEDWQASAILGLPGRFQAENWALAARLAHLAHLKIRNRPLPEEAIRRGAAEVHWPGRLEEFPRAPGGPNFLVDGAHTPNSVNTIVEELRRLCPAADPRVVLFACAKDKDAEGMLRALASYASEIVFTCSGNARGRAPEELAGLWRQIARRAPVVQPDLDKALAAARTLAAARPDGLLVALGSLYLVGALKERQDTRGDAGR